MSGEGSSLEVYADVAADGTLVTGYTEGLVVARVLTDQWHVRPLLDVARLVAAGVDVMAVEPVHRRAFWFGSAEGADLGVAVMDARGAGALALARDLGDLGRYVARLALDVWISEAAPTSVARLLGATRIGGTARRLREATGGVGDRDRAAIAATAATEYLSNPSATTGADSGVPTWWLLAVGGDRWTARSGAGAYPAPLEEDERRPSRRAALSAAVLAAHEAESFGTKIDSPRGSRRPRLVDRWDFLDFADDRRAALSWVDPVADEVLAEPEVTGEQALEPYLELSELLTERERLVLVLKAEGHTPGKIGELVGVSRTTVRNDLAKITEKLRALAEDPPPCCPCPTGPTSGAPD